MNIDVSYLLTEAVVMFVVWDRLADAVDHKCCLERPLRLQYVSEVWPLCICAVPGFVFAYLLVLYLCVLWLCICIFGGKVYVYFVVSSSDVHWLARALLCST